MGNSDGHPKHKIPLSGDFVKAILCTLCSLLLCYLLYGLLCYLLYGLLYCLLCYLFLCCHFFMCCFKLYKYIFETCMQIIFYNNLRPEV